MRIIAKTASWANTPRKASALRTAGFTCDRLWVHLLFFSIVPFAQADDFVLSLFSNMAISLLTLGVSLLGCLALYRKICGLLLSKYFICIATGACFTGTALLRATGLATASGVVLAIGCGILTGIGSALLYLGWVRVLGDEGLDQGLKEIGCAVAISFALAVLCALCGPLVCLLTLLATPLCSGALLRTSSFLRDERHVSSAAQESSTSSAKSVRVRKSFGIFVFGLVGGFANILCSNKMYTRSNDFSSWLLVAGLAISLLVAVLVFAQGTKAIRQAHRLALLLMATGCMSIALSPETTTMANMMVYAGFSCFGTMLLMLALATGKAERCDAIKVICSTVGCLYVGEFIGLAVGHSAEFFAGSVALNQVGFVLVVALLVSYLFLLTETDLAKAVRALAQETADGKGGAQPSATTVDTAYAESLVDSILAANPAEPIASRKMPIASPAASFRTMHTAQTVGSSRTTGASAPFGSNGSIPSVSMGVASAAGGTLTFADAQAQEPADDAKRFQERCDLLANDFALSPRETEVLPLLLRGRTIARIQEELFISASTVNTHIRHIYGKCEVANKQELLDLFEERY